MSRNHKFFFDKDGSPKARGPAYEKTFMTFLEVDVQGSDHICRDLMDDLTAIEDESDDSREFIGNAHQVTITADGVLITPNQPNDSREPAATILQDSSAQAAPPPDVQPHPDGQPHNEQTNAPTNAQGYLVALKHFREILEDWEAFILDDQLDNPMADDEFL